MQAKVFCQKRKFIPNLFALNGTHYVTERGRYRYAEGGKRICVVVTGVTAVSPAKLYFVSAVAQAMEATMSMFHVAAGRLTNPIFHRPSFLGNFKTILRTKGTLDFKSLTEKPTVSRYEGRSWNDSTERDLLNDINNRRDY